MKDTARFKFNSERWREKMLKALTENVIEKLKAYAKEEINNIGASLLAWDRTGNLLDSICWGLYKDGKEIASGFYRAASATETSYLHELSKPPKKRAVNGRECAVMFLNNYTPTISKGIELVFGVLIPYWAYWEREGGHYNVLKKQVIQFRALFQRYDEIKKALSPPMRVTYQVKSPE